MTMMLPSVSDFFGHKFISPDAHRHQGFFNFIGEYFESNYNKVSNNQRASDVMQEGIK